jgi:cell division protease FtsH
VPAFPCLFARRRRALLLGALAATSLAVAPAAQASPAPAGTPPYVTAPRAQDTLDYGGLLREITAGHVRQAAFSSEKDTVDVRLADGSEQLVTVLPGAQAPLATRLVAAGATVRVDGDGSGRAGPGIGLWTVLKIIGVLAMLFTVGGVILLRGRRHGLAGGDGGSGRANREARRAARLSDVRFEDVAGCDEAVEEVAELVAFLRDGERFRAVGAKMPSGVVLFGPPGTGKTLLAKALAGEAGVPFFAVTGSDFVEKYVGVGAKRVRELFAAARRCEHGAVVFIDEIDAVGGRRTGGDGGNREADNTLNQLLAELDGFHDRSGVIVVAATNRLDTLDPALLRPGRFSRHIQVSPPDEAGRRAILALHGAGKPLSEDADLDRLARITAGNSGAELADILNEAAIWAAREHRTEVTDADLWEGLCRVIAGPRKAGDVLAAGERETVAVHEAGHVLAGDLCPTQDRTEHATINARGRALGFALKGRTDRGLQTEQFLHESLIVILAGRAAEHVRCGAVTSGAASDLQQASVLARTAVEQWGLSDRVGQLSTAGGGFSGATQGKVDEEVARLIGDAYHDAVELIRGHTDQLDRLTEALLAAGEVSRTEIELALRGARVAPRPPRRPHAPTPPPRVAHAQAAGHPSGRRRRNVLHDGGRVLTALTARLPWLSGGSPAPERRRRAAPARWLT